MSPASAEGLTPLQVECLSKLAPIRFGTFSPTDRIVVAVRHQHAQRKPLSPNMALALYKICWRYREQIQDWTFIARAVIAKCLLEESLDLADVVEERVYARAWRAPPAPVATLFTKAGG